MTGLLAALAAATPSPSPSVTPAGGGSPGFLGFVFTFGLAIAAAGIFLSLTRHLRIVDRRAREQATDERADGPTDDRPDVRSDEVRDDDVRDDEPRVDLGMVDAGAGGPDLELDANLPVASDDRGPAGESAPPGDDEPRR